MNPIHKEALCIMCGCCVSECNSMESDPSSSARRRSPRASASSATRATAPKVERLELYNEEHGIWDCTRCYFCNERCPKGVDPRDAIAKLGAESIKEGIDRDMGAKHAKWFVRSAETTGWLRETELVPKTQGVVEAIKETKFAIAPREARQGAAADPAARRRGRQGGPRALRARPRRRGATARRDRPGRAALGADRAHGRGLARRDAPEITPASRAGRGT